MKTKPIIVLRRDTTDRLGGAKIDYHDGEIRPQTFGAPYISPKGVGGAKVYATIEAAQAAKDNGADLLSAFEPVVENLWLPQDGELVVYEARSGNTGTLANVRLAQVRKTTRTGYVHLLRVAEAFNRYAPEQFVQACCSTFRCHIRPASPGDLAGLPSWGDMAGAQKAARELNAKAAQKSA